MSDETTTLDEVIQRFVTAEQALVDLRSRQSDLIKAAERFREADTDLRNRTGSALSALEEARERLREQMKNGAEVAKDTRKLQGSFAETTREIGLVLETLRSIDPAEMSRGIGEIRRDAADNAAELRELRRLIFDLQRNQDSLAASQAELAKASAGSTRHLGRLLPVGIATLLASLTGCVLLALR
jgi:hypothetical protein